MGTQIQRHHSFFFTRTGSHGAPTAATDELHLSFIKRLLICAACSAPGLLVHTVPAATSSDDGERHQTSLASQILLDALQTPMLDKCCHSLLQVRFYSMYFSSWCLSHDFGAGRGNITFHMLNPRWCLQYALRTQEAEIAK